MTLEERITQLESRLAQAESRIAELERKPQILGPGREMPLWTNPCPDLYRMPPQLIHPPINPDELRVTCGLSPNVRGEPTAVSTQPKRDAS